MEKFKLVYRPMDELAPFRQALPDDMTFGFLYFDGQRYAIFIDSNGTPEQQARTLRHELAHLKLNHMDYTPPLAAISSTGDDMFGPGWIDREREADACADQMTDAEFAELMQYAI